MFEAIKYNLAHLLDFRGRESRSMFWWFVLFVAILRFVAGLLASIPLTVSMMSGAMSAGGSGRLDPQQLQAQMMGRMIEALPQMVWTSVIIGAATCVLLAAALARRLHDINLPGWLIVVAGAPYVAVLARMPASIQIAIDQIRKIELGATPPNPMAMVQAQGVWPLLAWLPVLFIVVVGCIKSNEGPNQYGEMPVTAE